MTTHGPTGDLAQFTWVTAGQAALFKFKWIWYHQHISNKLGQGHKKTGRGVEWSKTPVWNIQVQQVSQLCMKGVQLFTSKDGLSFITLLNSWFHKVYYCIGPKILLSCRTDIAVPGTHCTLFSYNLHIFSHSDVLYMESGSLFCKINRPFIKGYKRFSAGNKVCMHRKLY